MTLIFLSPSKTLDFESNLEKDFQAGKYILDNLTQSEFLDQTSKLVKEFKKYKPDDLQKLMKISEKLAILNFQRFQDFEISENSKKTNQKLPNLNQFRPALTAFIGDVYRDVEIKNYNEKQLEFAQKHLRTLSGLYGILKPLDLIQPYRLEMHLQTDFWRPILTKKLIEDSKSITGNQTQTAKLIINLASNEYSSALDFKKIAQEVPKIQIITPGFRTMKNGKPKNIALYSKIARGTMANWIVKNQITNPKDLEKFAEDGYKFAEENPTKTETELIFVRQTGDAKLKK